MTRLYAGTPGFRHMLILALMAAGFNSVELITNNLIPITCRHFTDSAFLISAILATNRLFGFVVQPYVCWKSDYLRTRYGRRRPFFLVGLPLTAVGLLFVGLLPVFIQGDARHTLPALLLVVSANVLLQAIVDVNWGSLEPLYADTFRHEQLGRAGSIRQIASQLVNLAMVSYVIGWADTNELYPYLFSIAGVLFSLALMIWVIREQPAGDPPPPERYSPLKHLGLLVANRDYTKLAFICAANLVLPAALFLFTPLYVTDTLGLTKGELGRAQMLGPFLVIALAFPVGWLVDRFGPKWIMASGFVLYAVAFVGLAFWTRDFWTLFTFMTVFGVAQVVALMPMTAMVFQYTSPTERGQVFGVVQFTRAFSAFVLSLSIGSVVQLADSYEPTPFRTQDLKTPTQFVARLSQPQDDVTRFVRARLSVETDRLLGQVSADTKPFPALTDALVADLNRLLSEPAFHTAERFAGVELSRQSRRLLDEKTTAGSRLIVLNRTLLNDAFPAELSRKADYRLPYHIGLVLACLATIVALTTRRGTYARTLATVSGPA
ncbi:MAG: MFS transporter [Opitutaceae bacterium]|nr:MFS transporter [Opitutaceae bacterium]